MTPNIATEYALKCLILITAVFMRLIQLSTKRLHGPHWSWQSYRGTDSPVVNVKLHFSIITVRFRRLSRMFGKKKLPPQEQAKEWKKSIRAERRGIDRQIRKIEVEEEKVKAKVKLMMKQGHQDAVMPLVQSIAQSKRAKSKLLKTGVQLDSLVRQIDMQIAEVKVAGCFKASAEVTHMMNQLIRLPEMQATAQRLQLEMQKAGLATEMLDEALDEVNGDVEPEDQELAVKMVFNEIARDVQKQTGKPIAMIPVSQEEIAADPEAARLAAPTT